MVYASLALTTRNEKNSTLAFMGRMSRLRKVLISSILFTILLAPYQFGYGGNPDEETFDPFAMFFVFGILFVGFLILLWIWDKDNEKREGRDGVIVVT